LDEKKKKNTNTKGNSKVLTLIKVRIIARIP
jgi:hypothetical protein